MASRVSGVASGWLVEREVELGEIDRALAGAVAGEGSLLLFEGPAGIGKTALLEAARDRAEQAGVVVLPARGAELEGGFPYGVVRQLLEPTVRAADGPARERLLAGAAALAGPAVLGAEAAPIAMSDPAFAVVHGLYWLVANLSSEAPLAVVLDDVHWSDPPSLRFFLYLARRLDGMAATVIASVRTGEAGSDQGLVGGLAATPGARSVSPEALTDAGVVSVLSADFGQTPDPEFARTCRSVTGGNPFYVHELARSLKEDGVEPTAAATERISHAAPPTIATVTLTRLGRLSDDATELARAIAVLGSDASLPRAASLAELDELRAAAAFDALVAADVVLAGRALEFRHPIVRAAIYDEIAPGARSTAHRQAAALLTAEGADIDVVARHLLVSRPIGSDTTIETLREAASHALTVGASDSAASYLARALEEGPERDLRATVLLELGLAEQAAGLPRAIERYEEVRRIAADPALRARAMIEQAWLVWYGGDWRQMLELLRGALVELADEDPLRVRVDGMLAMAAVYDPRLVNAFAERRPILEQLAASGGPGTRPLALILAAWGAQRDEGPARVRALVELGWDDGRYLDDGDPIELLPQGIGALLLCDHLDLAAAIVERLRATARTQGSAMQYMVAGSHDAMIETVRGNLTAAAVEMRSCLEQALELKLQFAVAGILWYCADVLLERPDVADLAALVEKIELGPFADVESGALLIETRGRLRFAAGDTGGAIADLRHAGAVHDALQITNSIAFSAWRSTLALMLDRSHRDEGLALAAAELDTSRHSGQARRIGAATRTLGMLEPDRDTARDHLEEAVTVLENAPSQLEYARALVELGAARRRNGERADARAPLRDGLDLATHCGAVRLAERAHTELAATGARPRRPQTTGRDALTPSERRVALMAADGRTSQEIAQALFVTTKTIDMHLNHSYAKLHINSRKQLAAALEVERT